MRPSLLYRDLCNQFQLLFENDFYVSLAFLDDGCSFGMRPSEKGMRLGLRIPRLASPRARNWHIQLHVYLPLKPTNVWQRRLNRPFMRVVKERKQALSELFLSLLIGSKIWMQWLWKTAPNFQFFMIVNLTLINYVLKPLIPANDFFLVLSSESRILQRKSRGKSSTCKLLWCEKWIKIMV